MLETRNAKAHARAPGQTQDPERRRPGWSAEDHATRRCLILVDHNEVAQALPGIQNATILEIWRRVREKKGLLQVTLLVTDISKKGSHVWFAGERHDLLEQALGGTLINDGMYVEGCMSRKKQVVSALEETFAKASAGAAIALRHLAATRNGRLL